MCRYLLGLGQAALEGGRELRIVGALHRQALRHQLDRRRPLLPERRLLRRLPPKTSPNVTKFRPITGQMQAKFP